jgi:hypothetical protein
MCGLLLLLLLLLIALVVNVNFNTESFGVVGLVIFILAIALTSNKSSSYISSIHFFFP